MDCFLALSFLSWSVDTLNHFLSQTVIQGVFSNWDERRKDVLTWNSSHVLLGTSFHIGESPLCIFSCSICKHLIGKCTKEFFISSTRFDKILMQNPQNISWNKTKGRSCISSEEPFQRLVPGRVCGMSAKPSTVWDRGQGAAGRSEERGRSCIWVIESCADSPQL